MQLAIDKNTYDLYKPVGGGVTRVSEGRFVIQQVTSKLKTALGEWSLDPSVGWINLNDYNTKAYLFDLETRARIIILETEHVSAIQSMELVLSSRILTLTFTATTDYGIIDLTVPWEDT
jgi:hypothetical protein